MAERGLGLDELLDAAGLERRVLEAIVHGRYTPSPQQRQRVAAALGVEPGQVAWGHVTPVEHIQGHGPQFGRSP
jgi:hypothetical protein